MAYQSAANGANKRRRRRHRAALALARGALAARVAAYVFGGIAMRCATSTRSSLQFIMAIAAAAFQN